LDNIYRIAAGKLGKELLEMLVGSNRGLGRDDDSGFFGENIDITLVIPNTIFTAPE
jgi:hypothetical protein